MLNWGSNWLSTSPWPVWDKWLHLIVDWTQENSHLPFHYDISISPQLEGAIARFIDNTSIQLTVPYNVSFNVSITTSLCDRTRNTISNTVSYTKVLCDVPVLQPNVQAMVNYSQPLIGGSILSFTCLPGLILSGPNSTTCFSNGQWTPNPELVKCKGLFKK